MRSHDMAKIGYLFLNDGWWQDKQVVPASWVEASTRKHISSRILEDGYGYQWWVNDSGMFMALGYRGQYIVVVPEAELVVVFTSDLDDSSFFVPRDLITDYILPAVKTN